MLRQSGNKVRRVLDEKVILHEGVTTSLSAPDAAAMALLPPLGACRRTAMLAFDATGPVILSSVRVRARADGAIRFVGDVNAAQDLTLDVDDGYEERIEAAEWDRLAVSFTYATGEGSPPAVTVTLYWEEEY